MVRGVRVSDELWQRLHETGPCPVCGKPSFYNLSGDRFVHADGSENRRCWAFFSANIA